jgi:basic membrane protein A
MTKKVFFALAIVLVVTMVLGACAPKPGKGFKACEVTDMGGVDDKSFNAAGWLGVQQSMKDYGIEGVYLESKQQTDYANNINAFLTQNCNIIVGVGFLLGDAVKAAAEANPNQKFAIIDVSYDPIIPNVRGNGSKIDQATFLAGYLAAGMTKTGKVATYGGMQFPSVTLFMDGFVFGVNEYNKVHGTTVTVLGWDTATQTGSFTGDFSNTDNGKSVTLAFLDEGADIILPVAGPVGQGTLAALKERGTGLMIGVDTNWSLFYPDYKDFILASAFKKIDVWEEQVIKTVIDGTFVGGTDIGDLSNGLVGLVYGSAWDSKIPATLKTEIDGLKAGIVDGTTATHP